MVNKKSIKIVKKTIRYTNTVFLTHTLNIIDFCFVNTEESKNQYQNMSIIKKSKGLFSCDVCDIEKDIVEGKAPQNLDFK